MKKADKSAGKSTSDSTLRQPVSEAKSQERKRVTVKDRIRDQQRGPNPNFRMEMLMANKNKQRSNKVLEGGHTLKEFQESDQCDGSICMLQPKEENLETTLKKIDDHIELLSKGVVGNRHRVEVDSEELSTEEFDKVYQSALSSVVNASGRLPRTVEEYEKYLQEACGMGAEKHQVLKRRVQHEVAELRLHVSVLEAEGLIAKDTTGTSDPYCRMALVHEREVSKPHRDLNHWERKRVVHTVIQTDVIEKTLTPVWNAAFQMLILDPQAEYLAVEVWDSDADTSSLLRVKGIQGIKSYIQDLSGKDDFLGKVYIPLSVLNVEGSEKWYSLQSHRGNPRGRIKLKLQVHSKLPYVKEEAAMSTFCQFYRLLVSHKRRMEGEFAQDWNGLVDPVGEDLLRLYATRVDLKRLHEAVCKLKILYRDKITCPFAILSLIETIRDSREDLEEANTAKPPKQWVGSLIRTLMSLSSEVLKVVKKHQNIVTLKTGGNVGLLTHHLKLLKAIYQVDSYVITLDKNTANLPEVVTIALRSSCAFWYQKLITTAVAAVEGNQKVVVTIAAVRGMVNFLTRAQSQLSPLFDELGVSYFDVVYTDMDRQLAGDLEEIMAQVRSNDASTDLYLLYQALAAFSALSSQLKTGKREKLKLREFYSLFKPLVEVWIEERMSVFEEGMWKAVKNAEAVPILETVKYSTAVRDTIDLMIRVCGFLKGLDWQQPEEYVSFLLLIIQRLCDKVLKFVQYISTKLKKASFYLVDITMSGMDLKMVSEKLCVHLNDIQQLRTGLRDLPNYLNWESQRQSICSDQSAEAVSRVYDTIGTLLCSADEDMHHEMLKVYSDSSMSLRGSLTCIVRSIVSSEEILEKRIETLFDYLTELLTILYKGLFTVVFKGILEAVWTVVIDVVADTAREHDSNEEASRLVQTLGAALAFFNSNGEGLEEGVMRNKKYLELNKKLQLRTFPTEKVISQYLEDLVTHQQNHYSTRGSLSLSVGYDERRGCIEVTIIKASDLARLDARNNSSDPFVIVELAPRHMFAQVKSEKTSVIKSTVDPVFNEEFKLYVCKKALSQRGAVVLFQVFDYDFLTSNDFIGAAVVPCSQIPIINSTSSSNILSFSGRRTETLPLFLLPETQAYRELHSRVGHKDVLAQEFLKKAKKLM